MTIATLAGAIRTATLAIGLCSIAGAAHAADQTRLGEWNAQAAALAAQSPLVRSSMEFILATLGNIRNEALRRETLDLVNNRRTCLRHRANLDDARRRAIVDRLTAEGLIDPAEAERIPGGIVAGVFPPVIDDGSACPRLPQPYMAAPGSVYGGHHSEPGGLPIHVAFNLSSALSLAENYRRIYGFSGTDGLPRVAAAGAPSPTPTSADVLIDQDIVIAAPIWHDWAKAVVFQWNADGGEFVELNFGGNGRTDMWGAAGNSKTAAHHMIGIAEAMARNLPREFIIAQASAHGAPTSGNEFMVVNWIRAAAIIANVDPVERGYLVRDNLNRPRLAPVRQLGSVDILASLPNQSNVLVEYVIHNLSDADYTFTGPVVAQSQLLLQVLASRYGYDMNQIERFNTAYRNPALSFLSAERLMMIYAARGLEGVTGELDRLREAGII